MRRSEQSLNTAFGKALRRRRHEVGISQEELAARAGVHRTYVSLLERGQKSPSLDVIGNLAAALDRLPHELVRAAEEARRRRQP